MTLRSLPPPAQLGVEMPEPEALTPEQLDATLPWYKLPVREALRRLFDGDDQVRYEEKPPAAFIDLDNYDLRAMTFETFQESGLFRKLLIAFTRNENCPTTDEYFVHVAEKLEAWIRTTTSPKIKGLTPMAKFYLMKLIIETKGILVGDIAEKPSINIQDDDIVAQRSALPPPPPGKIIRIKSGPASITELPSGAAPFETSFAPINLNLYPPLPKTPASLLCSVLLISLCRQSGVHTGPLSLGSTTEIMAFLMEYGEELSQWLDRGGDGMVIGGKRGDLKKLNQLIRRTTKFSEDAVRFAGKRYRPPALSLVKDEDVTAVMIDDDRAASILNADNDIAGINSADIALGHPGFTVHPLPEMPSSPPVGLVDKNTTLPYVEELFMEGEELYEPPGTLNLKRYTSIPRTWRELRTSGLLAKLVEVFDAETDRTGAVFNCAHFFETHAQAITIWLKKEGAEGKVRGTQQNLNAIAEVIEHALKFYYKGRSRPGSASVSINEFMHRMDLCGLTVRAQRKTSCYSPELADAMQSTISDAQSAFCTFDTAYLLHDAASDYGDDVTFAVVDESTGKCYEIHPAHLESLKNLTAEQMKILRDAFAEATITPEDFIQVLKNAEPTLAEYIEQFRELSTFSTAARQSIPPPTSPRAA